MLSPSTAKRKKIKNDSKSDLSKEYSENISLINHSSNLSVSDLTDISTTKMSDWMEKDLNAIRNKEYKSNSNNEMSNIEQNSISTLSDTSSVFLEEKNEKINKNAISHKKKIKKIKSKQEKSTSEAENYSIKSDASINDWKKKNIKTIKNKPITSNKRIYGDGSTSEEPQSENFSDLNIIEEEEEAESMNYASSNVKSKKTVERDIPILDAENLSSASSVDTGDVKSIDGINLNMSDQENKKRKKKKIKKIKKNRGPNSVSYTYESASETLSNYSESKHNNNSYKTIPRNTISKFNNEESYDSKIYFNSETSDAPAVKRVKKKIDSLISPRRIETPSSTRGIRVEYTDEEIVSPRRRQKYAQILVDGDSNIIEYSTESDMIVYGRLPNEKHPHNVTDSEISDISLVDFNTPKVKYLKSPAKDILANDSDYTFHQNQLRHENSNFSSSSNPIQSRDISLDSETMDDEITNDVYEEAQRKIQKYAIDENEVQENGALFDIKIPDSDEEGKLLLDLKKNAIMLSSSPSQESDVEDEDKLEMLGEMVVKRGLPFLKLSDSESEDGPVIIEEEEEGNIENVRNLNSIQNDESSEPPIQYDPLLAPKSLTTPRSPKTPRTPNEPLYTGKFILSITVIEAINLPRKLQRIRLEPYVYFKIKGSKDYKRTKTCRYTKIDSPSSLNSTSKSYSNSDDYTFDNEKLVFTFNPDQSNILVIKIRNEDKFSGDVDVSGYDFDLSSLKLGESDGWFRLTTPKNAQKGGKLHIHFNLEREIKPEIPHTPKSPKALKNHSSQNSEHSQHSHHSKISQHSESHLSKISQQSDSQVSLGNDTEIESNNNDDLIDDNFSSISEGNRKRDLDNSLNSLSDHENEIEANLDSIPDSLDSLASQHLSSPEGSNFNSNE